MICFAFSQAQARAYRLCAPDLWLLIFFSVTAALGAEQEKAAQNTSAPAQPLAQPFDDILHRYVTDGQVNYPGIAADPRFNTYLEQLKQTDAETLPSRTDKLAFWINAYNALAIKGILDGYSPSTFFGKVRFFYNNEYMAGSKHTNLYDLEHKILIPLKEPRIHFSIVCASKSCPKLRSEAYTAERLEQQLEDNARQFINDKERNRFDRQKKIAYLSEIFDWFEEDFSAHSGSVLKYAARYAKDPELAHELEAGSYIIKYLTYDWSLNGTPSKANE